MSSPTPTPATRSLVFPTLVAVAVVAVSAALVVVSAGNLVVYLGGWPGLIGLVGLYWGARIFDEVYEAPRMSWGRRVAVIVVVVAAVLAGAVVYANHRADIADQSVVHAWRVEKAETLAEDAADLARWLAEYRAEGAEGDPARLHELETEVWQLGYAYQGLAEQLIGDGLVGDELGDSGLQG